MKTAISKHNTARLKDYLFNDALDIHVRHFNLLALIGISASLLMGIVSLFTTSLAAAVACFILCVFASLLLTFSVLTGKFRLCYQLTVIVIFIFGFSLLFFLGGGSRSGCVQFFIFAVVFTALLLEGRELKVMICAEIVVYTADFLIAWRWPQSILHQLGERELIWEALLSTIMVAVALGASVSMHVALYHRQQAELELAKKAAEDANSAKTVFLSNISHELKTPLTVVSGYAQTCEHALLSEGILPEEARKMRFISTECDRMAMLVLQLLDMARFEEGGLVLRKKAVQADEVIKRTLDAYSPLIRKNGNDLVFHRLYDLPLIQADEDRLRQVLLNLLTNAARHTQNGTVTVDMAQDSGMLAISVSDTGEGIPEDLLSQLFTRFPKKENRTVNDTGTGLGLYICRLIVEAHGGTISVKSREGEGTTVRFTLPMSVSS